MKLTIFQSDKGDCLMLEERDGGGKRMLIDGGMASSYSEHVAPTMGKLKKAKKSLDVVYVSHIDDDHISGVRQLLDDLVAWRVFRFQSKSGNTRAKEPKAPEPPTPKQIWHNGFHKLLKDNAEAIEDALSASATVLSLAPDNMRAADTKGLHQSRGILLSDLAEQNQDLATGVKTAIEVSNRISPAQLKIPLNPPDEKLMLVRADAKPIKLGTMRIQILGPRSADLKRLRDDWNEWLRTHKEELSKLRQKAKETEDKLGSEVERVMAPMIAQAKELGNSSSVTPPNLASLMLLVEQGTGNSVRRLILTGDGLGAEVIHGLKDLKKLRSDGTLHVDVLKMMHHGSEHNMDADFPKLITADHYIFCGNGFSDNPEEVVVEAVLASRLSTGQRRSKNPEAGNPFHVWINTHSSGATNPKYRTHLKKIEKIVNDQQANSNGQLTAHFLKEDAFAFSV
jgi:beta-lactamase superfamily II metal-dependent hydrolase